MIGQRKFFMINYVVISILPLYEKIRLHYHQQETIETCLQVLNFEVFEPDIRKNLGTMLSLCNINNFPFCYPYL